MTTECVVNFIQITADGKGRVYGLDRAGRVWSSCKTQDGIISWWEQATDKGYRA
jgi:hypothetical protein